MSTRPCCASGSSPLGKARQRLCSPRRRPGRGHWWCGASPEPLGEPPAAESAGERDFLATGRSVLSAIPGVQQFSVSRQVSEKSNFAFQFAMVFADQAAYDAYNTHPDHLGFVAGRWVPEVAEFQEFDFVTLEG
ncbi:MAG: Dabb family protein [Propionicimonas sp.]